MLCVYILNLQYCDKAADIEKQTEVKLFAGFVSSQSLPMPKCLKSDLEKTNSMNSTEFNFIKDFSPNW